MQGWGLDPTLPHDTVKESIQNCSVSASWIK